MGEMKLRGVVDPRVKPEDDSWWATEDDSWWVTEDDSWWATEVVSWWGPGGDASPLSWSGLTGPSTCRVFSQQRREVRHAGHA